MLTRRDIVIALLAVCATLSVVVVHSQTPVMQSAAFDWTAIPAKPTEVGSARQFFRTPTVTLDELECHVTTLKAGAQSHPPHKHPNEELVIVKEGTVECLVNGEWKRLGAGFGDLQRLKSTARTQKCRGCTSDISRHQLAIAGDAEEGAAVECYWR